MGRCLPLIHVMHRHFSGTIYSFCGLHTHTHTRMGMCRHVSLPSFLFMSVGASDKRWRWTNRVTLLQCTYAAARPPPSAMYISWIRMKNSARNNSVPPSILPSLLLAFLCAPTTRPRPPASTSVDRPPPPHSHPRGERSYFLNSVEAHESHPVGATVKRQRGEMKETEECALSCTAKSRTNTGG